MKNKIHKILGIGLTLVLALALVGGFALPAGAAVEKLNEWYKFEYPVGGELGGWFMQGTASNEGIDAIGPMARAINDDLYAYTLLDGGSTVNRLFKSTDGARSWAATAYELIDWDGDLEGDSGAIVDMVCSSIDEDIIYATDGNYVYKSTDGGDTWIMLGRDSLETALEGACGTDIEDTPITCIDVGYGPDDAPYVFIGVDDTTGGAVPSAPEPTVLYINEEGYPAQWTDLELHCWHTDGMNPGNYYPYSIGCTPDFVDSKKTMVVVSTDDDLLSGEPETYVVSTVGYPCSWAEVSRLLMNCDPTPSAAGGPFEIREASRIAFPDDWEDTETLFVGVTGELLEFGGDVYMATVTAPPYRAQDMNVAGLVGGCVGKMTATNIISLDIYGDTDSASLIAGVYGYVDAGAPPHLFNEGTDVYCSSDGGWSWDVSAKDPTGGYWDGTKEAFEDGRVEVLWYDGMGLAATSGCECAVSLCCGEDYPCEFFSQISLIATDIDCVIWGDHSPEYLSAGSETMYLLTADYDACTSETIDTQSLFRWDQTYWERVFCSTISGADYSPAFEMVEVSPDFDATSAVYLFNDRLEGWRTTDAGCSWDKLTFPCEPRPDVSAGIVIDEDTVIAGGSGPDDDGWIFKTTRHGARPWKKYEVSATAAPLSGDAVSFDLEPGYEDPGYVLFGDDNGRVWLSEDGGETWELVGSGALAGCRKVLGANDAWVVFDPGFNTAGDDGENTIYAAAGKVIARCTIDWDEDIVDQSWVEIYTSPGDNYLGIETIGDTALYVTNAACDTVGGPRVVTVDGTIEVRCPETDETADLIIDGIVVEEISDAFDPDELVSIIEYNIVYTDGCCYEISGDIDLAGVDSEVILSGTIPCEGEDYHEQGDVVIAYEPLSNPHPNNAVRVYNISGPFWHDEPASITTDLTTGSNKLWFDGWIGTDDVTGTFDIIGDWSGETGTVDIEFECENWFGDDGDNDEWLFMYAKPSLTISLYNTLTITDECLPDPVGIFELGDAVGITDDDMEFWQSSSSDDVQGWIDVEGSRVYIDVDWEDFMPAGSENLYVVGWDLEVTEVNGLYGDIGIKGHDSGATGMISIWACVDLGDEDQVVEVISSFLRATATGVAPAEVESCVVRSLNPLADVKPTMKVVFERLTDGLAGECLYGLAITHDVSDEGCDENVLWTLESPCEPENVWVYEDTTAQPVIAVAPLDERKLGVTDEVTLEWAELCGVECYEVSLFKYCAACPEEKVAVAIADLCPELTPECTTAETCIVIDDLEAGTTYYWQVRACMDHPTLSKWSVERTFITALGVTELVSPACGADSVIISTSFNWTAVTGATSYDIELATTETFTTGVLRGSSTVNAWAIAEPLDYATTYYWRVRAHADGVYSDWVVGIFTTAAKAIPAPPPVVVEPTPPAPVVPTPIIEMPPTPSWVWAIIGIGAALAVVVIVLIVRTRRPPA